MPAVATAAELRALSTEAMDTKIAVNDYITKVVDNALAAAAAGETTYTEPPLDVSSLFFPPDVVGWPNFTLYTSGDPDVDVQRALPGQGQARFFESELQEKFPDAEVHYDEVTGLNVNWGLVNIPIP
jgi:hypothetical protein